MIGTKASILQMAKGAIQERVDYEVSEVDPNIMELCFRNGEQHMKEKVGKELSKIAEYMPCITLAQAMAMLEGL